MPSILFNVLEKATKNVERAKMHHMLWICKTYYSAATGNIKINLFDSN